MSTSVSVFWFYAEKSKLKQKSSSYLFYVTLTSVKCFVQAHNMWIYDMLLCVSYWKSETKILSPEVY